MRSALRPLAAVAAILAALALMGAGQALVPEPGRRLVLHAGSTPAVDYGLSGAQVRGPGVPAEFAGPARAEAPAYVPGRVIVKFRGGAIPAPLTAGTGATATDRLPYANFDVLTIDPHVDPEEFARRLAAEPDVEYAQAAYTAAFYFVPNDPFYRVQWNYRALDMERAWDVSPAAGRSVVVAVLDSGIAFESVVLRYNTLPLTVVTAPNTRIILDYGVLDVPYAPAPDLIDRDRIVAPFDFTFNDRHPVDTLGHGTHVAGTIGQLTNNDLGVAGMAFNVRLMPVKVAAGGIWDFIFGAPSPFFSDDQVARAIRYSVDNGAKVLNMSFGRSTGGPAPVVEDALRYAVSRGAVCVFAAGNGALAGSPTERYAELAPRLEGVLAVGAVGPDLTRARYSSRGSWVELAAPGGDSFLAGIGGAIVQQTVDFRLFANILQRPRFDGFVFDYFQGTSMAAPHVSGFAALLMQQGVSDAAAIEDVMKRYATDLGPVGRDNDFGAGLINPRATLRGLGIAK